METILFWRNHVHFQAINDKYNFHIFKWAERRGDQVHVEKADSMSNIRSCITFGIEKLKLQSSAVASISKIYNEKRIENDLELLVLIFE